MVLALIPIENPKTIGLDSLSRRLRSETRQVHRDVEAAFDLEQRLVDRSAYGLLLLGLRSFFAAAEEILSSVSGWDRLTPTIDLSSRRRTQLLDADLAELGLAFADPELEHGRERDDPLPGLRANPTLARGLGLLYVLEGSALGGRIISRRALVVLGDGLPVSFFDGSRRNLGADWKSLQVALDAFVTSDGDQAGREVVGAAADAFAAFGSWIAPRTWPPV